LIDGIKVRQFYIALVGALMVTALALFLDALLALAVWSSVPGTGRLRRSRMPDPLIDDVASVSVMRRTSRPGGARGDSSLTVEG
jgi:osmoprotectant transport system permease protein